MGLDVIWRSESGDKLAAFYDSESVFANAVVAVSEREYPTLGRIDEYRTASLAPTNGLVDEVQRIRDATADAGAREQLSSLLSLLRRADVSPGTYLDFIGD